MSGPLQLVARSISCVRGTRKIFDSLDFSVSSGETLAVTGPNGSGKSSLLRLIAGLIATEHGTIELTGANADLTVPEQLHFLGHRDAVKPSLTVAENIAFWTAFLGGGANPIVAKTALDAVG